MRLYEFMNMGNPTIIGQARKIERIWKFQPISQKDMNWLIKLSKDEALIGKLYWYSQKMNHRAPIKTDHQLLTDAGTCASAYNILSDIQAQIRLRTTGIR